MKIPRRQNGLALLMLVFLMALAITFYSLKSLDSSEIQNERNKKTATALAEAKVALLGTVLGVQDATLPIYLPNPDSSSSLNEGGESGNLGATDAIVIGKMPWRDLGVAPLKDGWGECLWYVISGRYKRNPPSASAFNWDKQGQIDVIDQTGNVLATNLVALIVAPGQIVDNQNRALSNVNYRQCGGNYDARNYLDSYFGTDAIYGEVNYFAGSTDSRQATNALNKTFVLARNDHYNDQFIFITVDDIFDILVKRSDFVNELNAQLNNAAEDIRDYSVVALGAKGTDSIDCAFPGIKTDQTFCENWNEMFLLKENSEVNGAPCSKVFIFGGKKTGEQVRNTFDDKVAPANYLEEPNLSAFNGTGNFSGATNFDGNNPSDDVLKCIP